MDSREGASCDETPVRHTSDCKVGTIACEIDAAVYTLPFTVVNVLTGNVKSRTLSPAMTSVENRQSAVFRITAIP
jgi:hypothetical protein